MFIADFGSLTIGATLCQACSDCRKFKWGLALLFQALIRLFADIIGFESAL